jgi:hypothetical protein
MTRRAAGTWAAAAPPRPGQEQVPGIDSYLAEVAVRLPDPARAQEDIVAELRAGGLPG